MSGAVSSHGRWLKPLGFHLGFVCVFSTVSTDSILQHQSIVSGLEINSSNLYRYSECLNAIPLKICSLRMSQAGCCLERKPITGDHTPAIALATHLKPEDIVAVLFILIC